MNIGFDLEAPHWPDRAPLAPHSSLSCPCVWMDRNLLASEMIVKIKERGHVEYLSGGNTNVCSLFFFFYFPLTKNKCPATEPGRFTP